MPPCRAHVKGPSSELCCEGLLGLQQARHTCAPERHDVSQEKIWNIKRCTYRMSLYE